MTILLSDRKLLDAFRRGESHAIERIYNEYVDQVAGLLRRGFTFMSSGQSIQFRGYDNAWDLECAVQDTFISAFSPSARQVYDGINPFGPYLMTIARNKVISQLRSDMREFRRRARFKAQGIHTPAKDPEREAMKGELKAIFEQFKTKLTEDQRKFVDCRYGEDRNLLETARMLGLTRMKARTIDRKIRETFVRFLRRSGHVTDHNQDPLEVLTILAAVSISWRRG